MKKWRSAREIIDWSMPSKSIFNRKRPLAKSTIARIAAGLKKFGGKNLVMLYGTNNARSVDRPLPTVTAGGNHIGLCEPFLIKYHGGRPRVHPVSGPIPTIDTSNRFGLCEPFIVKYNGTGKVKSIDVPLDTITTKDRFGLVEPVALDIQLRMLQPSELAAAMSFPSGYMFNRSLNQQ